MKRTINNRNVSVDPENVFSIEAEDVLKRFEVDQDLGLNEETVKERREQYGTNKLRQHKKRSNWSVLVSQFKSIIIGLLAAAAAIAFIYGEWVEGWAVFSGYSDQHVDRLCHGVKSCACHGSSVKTRNRKDAGKKKWTGCRSRC
ncbi:MAG: cation-transporting P-type ATPase [Gracilimonas sp.]|nr:cation-transporting P-type ATPase [Gracilimonas sp.]